MKKTCIYGVETVNAMQVFTDYGKLDITQLNGYVMDIPETVKDKRVSDYVRISHEYLMYTLRQARLHESVRAFNESFKTRKKTIKKEGVARAV